MKKSAIPDVWEVPQVFRDRLGDRTGRQRAMVADGHLLLVMHKAPKPDQDLREAALFWRQPTGEWMATEQGQGLVALSNHLGDYESMIDHWEELEQQARSANSYFQVLENLAPLHRACRNMHAVLGEARKQVSEDRNLINLRDNAYDLDRRAELLYSTAKNGLDYAVARRAEEQAHAANQMARSAHRLNLLAAFFFPLATLSAIFGVNLKFGLEESPPPLLFLIMLGVGLAMGIGLTFFVTPKSKSQPVEK